MPFSGGAHLKNLCYLEAGMQYLILQTKASTEFSFSTVRLSGTHTKQC